MTFAFYITNHGFGHASRNVPIIEELLSRNIENKVIIKSDTARNEFLQRNLAKYSDRIAYYNDMLENGLILKAGHMIPDIPKMKSIIQNDFKNWDKITKRETDFLIQSHVDTVVADTVAIGIKAASMAGIYSILIGNFDWAQIYHEYYGEEIWKPYVDCYKLADLAIWYELHSEELHNHNSNFIEVSLVSRKVDWDEVENIKSRHSQPIIFVSLGGSAELSKPIDVSGLPYDFIITRGINLTGDNVYPLPLDMINTPDYIAASEYVISKGGWSTVAEILLLRKKCALLMRGNNAEDNHNKEILEQRHHCIALNGDELDDIGALIERISALNPDSYDIYADDAVKICDLICGRISE
ncbi:MAG: hypothetical protein IJV15_10555 [Lachnospiraceae bacterium]|nr:hypothetical protein [Lachnospiraceae bacterium]